jgi:hypothetical protein
MVVTVLRRLILLAFIAANLVLQTSSAYVCRLMDQPPATHCCCPGMEADRSCSSDHDCGQPQSDEGGPCCSVVQSYEGFSSQSGGPTCAESVQQALTAVAAADTGLIFDLVGPLSRIHIASDPFWLDGQDTYLITSRLRN